MQQQIKSEISQLDKYTEKQKTSLRKYLEGFGEDDIYFFDKKQKVEIVDGVPVSMLAYSHGAFKIASVAAMKGFDGLVKNAVALIAAHFVTNYVSMKSSDEMATRAAQLSDLILNKFEDRMSLFGLLNAIKLLASGEYPCDVRLSYGYDGQGILQALNKYCSVAKSDYDRLVQQIKIKKDDEKKVIQIDPIQFAEFEAKMKKFDTALDFEKQRAFSKQVAAGEIDINKEIRAFAPNIEESEIDFG